MDALLPQSGSVLVWKVMEIDNAVFQDLESFGFLLGLVLKYPEMHVT